MKTEQLQVIKEHLTNLPDGWTISQGIKIIEQLSFDGIALVAEVERLQAEVARYKEGYEICNSGMYRAFCWYKDAQAQLDRTELAEAKARMENEQLREALEKYAAVENHERVAHAPDVYENGYEQPTWEPSWIELDKGELARKALVGDSDAI